ncbi:unnamed protein product, partial [Mesorhabditis spiculigera]
MGVLFVLLFISVADAFLSLHSYTQCIRQLRVGDVITIKGHVIAGARQWKCSIAEHGMNNSIIHADHRISTGRGNPCTVLNASSGSDWETEEVKSGSVPFIAGPFEMSFRILEEWMVEVYYKNASWAGTTYKRNETVPLSTARQVECHGDVLDVSFHGVRMTGKVEPVDSRDDCLKLSRG